MRPRAARSLSDSGRPRCSRAYVSKGFSLLSRSPVMGAPEAGGGGTLRLSAYWKYGCLLLSAMPALCSSHGGGSLTYRQTTQYQNSSLAHRLSGHLGHLQAGHLGRSVSSSHRRWHIGQIHHSTETRSPHSGQGSLALRLRSMPLLKLLVKLSCRAKDLVRMHLIIIRRKGPFASHARATTSGGCAFGMIEA